MQLEFDTRILDNGLKVIVHHDPSVATVAVDICYHVGAKHERPDRTGFAHLFEHLMFRGSKHVKKYDTYVEAAGGTNNAFTSNDITNYYLSLPANQLETAFWLESDRMLELDFSEENLALEKSIVIEEFKQRYLNQPYGDAYLHLRPLMFKEHPYQWMTIGKSIEQIEQATLADVKSFFFNFYAPNNATLVVAGGAEPETVFELAQKWFGPIPKREVEKRERPTEPRQTAPRAETVRAANAPHPMVYRAYHIPKRSDDRHAAAEALSELLSGGANAWLYERLVKQHNVASAVGAFTWGLYDTGKFSINARLADGVRPEQYEAKLDEALDELRELQPQDLERQVRKIESEEVFQKASVTNRALFLALADSIDSPARVNAEIELYKQLTLEDLHSFRTEFLVPDNCSTLYYMPENRAS